MVTSVITFKSSIPAYWSLIISLKHFTTLGIWRGSGIREKVAARGNICEKLYEAETDGQPRKINHNCFRQILLDN